MAHSSRRGRIFQDFCLGRRMSVGLGIGMSQLGEVVGGVVVVSCHRHLMKKGIMVALTL